MGRNRLVCNDFRCASYQSRNLRQLAYRACERFICRQLHPCYEWKTLGAGLRDLGKLIALQVTETHNFSFSGKRKMFDRAMRPVGYGLAIVGIIALPISAVELFIGKDVLFSVAKSAVFILIGVLLVKHSTKAQ